MTPENLTQPQAEAWANLRLRFVKGWDDLYPLLKAADHYSLALVTKKKRLPVGDLDVGPTGSLLYVVDDTRTAVTPFNKLGDELVFA